MRVYVRVCVCAYACVCILLQVVVEDGNAAVGLDFRAFIDANRSILIIININK